MKIEREYLDKITSSETDSEFLEKVFSQPSEFSFLDKLNKSLKKQVMTAIKIEKFLDGSIQSIEESKMTEGIMPQYKGFFIKGDITLSNLNDLLSFFSCNNNPKIDDVNNSYIYYSGNYRIFVANQNHSDSKNICLLYVNESREQIEAICNTYFNLYEITEMNTDEVLKLSYDVNDLPYSQSHKDFNTNYDLISIQDALYNTYSSNAFDSIITLALVYRLKNLGWDKNYILYAADSGKAFNVLNSESNIKLNKSKIESLIKSNHIDEDLDLTESGRVLLLLLNYFAPMQTNGMGNLYASLNYYTSIKEIKDNFVSITHENTLLYGIKEEFFVNEKCLNGIAKNYFIDDNNYNTILSNSLNSFTEARAIGYAPNIQISKTDNLDFETCQNLYNTFSDNTLDTLGGLVMIKDYSSNSPVFVNSLVYQLIRGNNFNITPFVSNVNRDYVLFKDNESNEILGLIKTKNMACQKAILSTQDSESLINKFINNHNEKFYKGIEINEYSIILGKGFIEKSQLTKEDFSKLLTVPFKEIKLTVRNLNRDSYFNDLNEPDLINKIISQRQDDYGVFVKAIKDEMNDKLNGLQLIYEYFNGVGNEEKKSYYTNVISDYKDKIDKFVI